MPRRRAKAWPLLCLAFWGCGGERASTNRAPPPKGAARPTQVDVFARPIEDLDHIEAEFDMRVRASEFMGFACAPGTRVRLRLIFDRVEADEKARLSYAELDVLGGARLVDPGPLGGEVRVYRIAAWRQGETFKEPYAAVAHFDRYVLFQSQTYSVETLTKKLGAPWPPTLRQVIDKVFSGPPRKADAGAPIDWVRLRLRGSGSRLGTLALQGMQLELGKLEFEAKSELSYASETRRFVGRRSTFSLAGQVGKGAFATRQRSFDLGRGTVDLQARDVNLEIPLSNLEAPSASGEVALGLSLEGRSLSTRNETSEAALLGTEKLFGRARFGIATKPRLALTLRDATVHVEAKGLLSARSSELFGMAIPNVRADGELVLDVAALAREGGSISANAEIGFCTRLREAATAGSIAAGTPRVSLRLLAGTEVCFGEKGARTKLSFDLLSHETPIRVALKNAHGRMRMRGGIEELTLASDLGHAHLGRSSFVLETATTAAGTRALVDLGFSRGSRLTLPKGDEVELRREGGKIAFVAILGAFEEGGLPQWKRLEEGRIELDIAPFSGNLLGSRLNAPAGARVRLRDGRLELDRRHYRLFGEVGFEIAPPKDVPILILRR